MRIPSCFCLPFFFRVWRQECCDTIYAAQNSASLHMKANSKDQPSKFLDLISHMGPDCPLPALLHCPCPLVCTSHPPHGCCPPAFHLCVSYSHAALSVGIEAHVLYAIHVPCTPLHHNGGCSPAVAEAQNNQNIRHVMQSLRIRSNCLPLLPVFNPSLAADSPIVQ